MKNIYEEVKFEVIVLTQSDVLTFSEENEKDDVVDDIFGSNK
jgi:hypothetical protein